MATEAEIEDMNTAIRMDLPVTHLEALALSGDVTPVSGDALMVYPSITR